ncbi:hypothetical protein AZE42_13304, partial [Rhizopogon vesiculosus]
MIRKLMKMLGVWSSGAKVCLRFRS